MPFPLLLLAVAGVAATGFFWNAIVDWLSGTVAAFIGDVFGAGMRSMFLEVVQKADKAAVAARRAVQQVFVKADVLFTKRGSTVEKQAVQWLRNPQDPTTAMRRTVTEEISVADLPDDLRKRLQAQDRVSGQLTMRQIG